MVGLIFFTLYPLINMVKISAIILTFNEERNIGRCLESILSVSDEIVVIDSFSTDQTEAICKRFEVKFVQHRFDGYIEQKNYGMSQASFDYILSLDADEALSPELLNSVMTAKQNWSADGYTMNRLSNYCGKWIRHSGWYPDRKMRLVDRRKGKWGGLNPHDKFIPSSDAQIKHLPGDIHHYSYYTFAEHEAQAIKFSDIASKALFDKGVKSNLLKLIYKPFARFIKTYFINLGILDGSAGFTIACMTAKSSYLRYLKLYKLQNQK
ncbi:MAG TPA: glycosyltransferase family 2 protein [Bacteroidia bacterium]|nr:glycosyltransferase family 2 protein [Bacteroidia bacterium]